MHRYRRDLWQIALSSMYLLGHQLSDQSDDCIGNDERDTLCMD